VQEGITVREWDRRFPKGGEPVRERYLARYGTERRPYLHPPSHWGALGDRRLNRLRYDPDPDSLGLCSLVESLTERLHARAAAGAKIVAAMKDLSTVPVLLAEDDAAATFYADMIYMQPCTTEETGFLDRAERRGFDGSFCDIRAIVGALEEGTYWPRPDLCLAAVGACCDDFSACVQHVESMGYPVHYWELPRIGPRPMPRDAAFIVRELEGVRARLERLLERPLPDDLLAHRISRVNELRRLTRSIRDRAYAPKAAPLPALEALLVEAIALDHAADFEAALELFRRVDAMCADRTARGAHAIDPDAVRLTMVTPSMDLCLQNAIEDLGGRVAGTEYMFGHAFEGIDPALPPLEALARNALANPMIGGAVRRGRIVCGEAQRYESEGVILVSFFGASHCAWENRIIAREVRNWLGLPSLVLNCRTAFHEFPESLRNRLGAFIDTLRERRARPAAAPVTAVEAELAAGPCTLPAAEGEAPPASLAERLSRLMREERAWFDQERGKGKRAVGLYCEYSPRELILAAVALPVCLCGYTHEMTGVAEADLPANLCPLIKSSYGYIRARACPFFEGVDAVIAETTCDGKKKMYERIRDRHPMFVLELTQKPGDETAFRHWHREVGKLKAFLEETLGTEITDGRLREAIRTMNRRRERWLALSDYSRSDRVYLSGLERVLLNLKTAGTPFEERILGEVFGELDRRRAADEPVAPPGAPRLLVTGVPMGPGAEKVVRLAEESGGIVVVQESCTGVKPHYENVTEEGDPLEAIARKYFHLPCSCFTPNDERFRLLDRLADAFRVDGVIDVIWMACHTYAMEHVLLRRRSRERHRPLLRIETDYAPGDTGQLRTRIESFVESIREGRGSR
jgi:benzoyl-CoA reductase/2-hydroxyglutaryl-CoA dehydratase subunit BcrC/BadD/HgdB